MKYLVILDKEFEKLLSKIFHELTLATATKMASEYPLIQPKIYTKADEKKLKKALGYTWYLDDEKKS